MYRAAALGSGDHAEEVDAHDAGEVLEIIGNESLQRAPDPRIVEHDVQAAKAIDGEVHQCLHLVRIAHVGLLEGSGLTDALGELRASVRVDIADDDLRSLGHEQLGRRLTDTTRSPGHDRYLSFELLRFHGATIRSRIGRCRPIRFRRRQTPGRGAPSLWRRSRRIYRQATRTRQVWIRGGASSNPGSTVAVWVSVARAVRPPRWSTRPATTAPATKIKEDHRNAVV